MAGRMNQGTTMKERDYDLAFEDDDLEKGAWSLYDSAKEQGSRLPRERLIRECRQLVEESLQKLKALGDQMVQEEESDDD
jgi:hypothetical protein